MKTLSIGELARKSGVGVETVRFYEREGLLAEPQRRASGYRQYDDEAISVIRFIRRAKELGFTLKEIKHILALRSDSSASRTEIRQQAQEKLADIEGKIADLQRMHEALLSLVKKCHGQGSIIGCPILEALRGNVLDRESTEEVT